LERSNTVKGNVWVIRILIAESSLVQNFSVILMFVLSTKEKICNIIRFQ